MVTLIDINKAINNKIKEALTGTEFSTVPLIAEDISEPITRPSIKVGIENSTNGKFNANCREKNLTCRVYFFAKDRYKYKLDNSKMQDIIETAFLEDLKINENFYIPIEEVESNVSDTVLISSFDLYSIELMPEPAINDIGEAIETMEELQYKEVIR
jgi:hypothetical protein